LAELIGAEPHHVGADELVDGAFHGLRVLIVDDDFRNIFALSALLERGHADVTVAESGSEALVTLDRRPDFDVVLMDIMMPIMDGYETIRAIRTIDRFRTLPIIAVTGKVMDGERQRCLDAGADDYVPKPIITADLLAALRPWNAVDGPVEEAATSATAAPRALTTSTPSPIFDANGTARPPTGYRPDGTGLLGQSRGAIEGVRVLVVDDDIRNIFALSALLERSHADVVVAESGAEALTALEAMAEFDVVLMDIMMPVMDGYDTMRAIRALGKFNDLPIIAVTGKVMDGERQRCIAAGANDYVPKPVDTAELLAALRPWMSKSVQSTMS
jgi:CheY-like chemotaxis protein